MEEEDGGEGGISIVYFWIFKYKETLNMNTSM
jgi:hypothetical protein